MWKTNPPHPVKKSKITCEVLDNKHFQEDFILTLKPYKKVNFKSGQFALIHNKKGSRPFSIASPPSMQNLQFLIRKHLGGLVTPFLHSLKKGDKVEITAPYGTFILKDEQIKNSEEIIFISAGTGLAPFHAMILDLLEKYPGKKVKLIHGFRHECFFDESWKELQKKYKNFEVYGACSKPSKEWNGLKGRVTEHLCSIIKSPEKRIVYICGGEAMVEDTKKMLLENCHFTPEQINIEEWRAPYKKPIPNPLIKNK